MSHSRLQTNVLAKFVDTTCILFYTQWRSNPPATLAIARGGTFQGAAKSTHRL